MVSKKFIGQIPEAFGEMCFFVYDIRCAFVCCIRQGQWTEALYCYSSCVKADSSNPVGFTNRALCYLKLNKVSNLFKVSVFCTMDGA